MNGQAPGNPSGAFGAHDRLAAEFARRFDPEELALDGVHLGPLLRLCLFYAHERSRLPAAAWSAGERAASPAPAVADAEASGAPPGPALDLQDGALLRPDAAARADLLVLRTLGDPPADADDLCAGAETAFGGGRRVAGLTLLGPGGRGEAGAVLIPRLAPLAVGPAEFGRFGAALAPRLRLARERLGETAPAAGEVLAWTQRFFGLERAFRAAFATLRPRAVMMRSWLRLETLAACAAARRLGIAAIDHQHGVFARGAALYLSWPDPPTRAIDPSPSHFWLWSEAFRAAAPAPTVAAQLVVGGDLRRGGNAPARPPRPGAGAILYLHQGLEAADDRAPAGPLPAIVAAAMAATGRARWRVRLHPRFAAQAGALEAQGLSARRATAAPLAGALAEADVVVTGYSAAAVEAHAAGRPVIFVHPLARALFGPMIAAGDMAYAEDAAELTRLLSADLPAPRGRAMIETDPDLSRRALATILGEAAAAPGAA